MKYKNISMLLNNHQKYTAADKLRDKQNYIATILPITRADLMKYYDKDFPEIEQKLINNRKQAKGIALDLNNPVVGSSSLIQIADQTVTKPATGIGS